MTDEKKYSNGQLINKLNGNRMTWFFKNGSVKAEGILDNNMMEGEWKFYRETGQLWQIGNFKQNMKHGSFTRYDKNDCVEYQETFVENKIVKKAQ